MTTESLIINYGINDRVGVYLFHHIIIVLYVCKRYYVAMPNGDIAGKIIILMILVFVEIKRLTVNYLSELSKNSKFYLSELSNFLIFVSDYQVLFAMQEYIQRNIDVAVYLNISENSAIPTLKQTMPYAI